MKQAKYISLMWSIYKIIHIWTAVVDESEELYHHFTPHGKIWTQLIDLAPNVWLHSSVGRTSHRYRGGHGFESHWSPDFFFQASSFQLLKLENLLRLSFFTFTFIFLSLIDYSSTQGSVSRKLWNLFGPEKPFLVNLIKKQRGVYAENFLYEESLCSY